MKAGWLTSSSACSLRAMLQQSTISMAVGFSQASWQTLASGEEQQLLTQQEQEAALKAKANLLPW